MGSPLASQFSSSETTSYLCITLQILSILPEIHCAYQENGCTCMYTYYMYYILPPFMQLVEYYIHWSAPRFFFMCLKVHLVSAHKKLSCSFYIITDHFIAWLYLASSLPITFRSSSSFSVISNVSISLFMVHFTIAL